MNLIFRFLRITLFSFWRPKLSPLDESLIDFIVMPTDLDLLLHMNNGKYFSLMDLGRVDFLIRIGLWKKLSKKNWYPVVVSETMRFRKSLQPFQRFQISTKTLAWDDRYVYLEQRFLRNQEVYALGLIKTRFLKKSGGAVSPCELIELIQTKPVSPAVPNYVLNWQLGEKEHSESALHQ